MTDSGGLSRSELATLRGERTLRAYSRPISLAQFDRIGWMTADEDLWPITKYLTRVSHTAILPPRFPARRLAPLDPRSYDAGLHGAPPHPSRGKS